MSAATEHYIDGNPYDLGRLLALILEHAAAGRQAPLATGLAILDAMLINTSVRAMLRDVSAGRARVVCIEQRYYVLPTAIDTGDDHQLLAAIVERVCAWGRRMLDTEVPLAIVRLGDDSAMVPYAVFDTPPAVLVHLPRRLLRADDPGRWVWHEFGHAFLRCGSRFLDEGWATWVELNRDPLLLAGAMVDTAAELKRQPQLTPLTQLLSSDFSPGVIFEDQADAYGSGELLYRRGALFIHEVVAQFGVAQVQQLFVRIKRGEADCLTLCRTLLGDWFTARERQADAAGPAPARAEDMQALRHEVLRLRAGADLAGLQAQVTDSLAQPAASPGLRRLSLDAYVSALELGGQFERGVASHFDGIAGEVEQCGGDVAAYELLARYTLMRIPGTRSAIQKAVLAEKAQHHAKAALQIDAASAEALLCNAKLLIHTPPQYGGDRDKAAGILREVAKRNDQFSAIAAAIHREFFGEIAGHAAAVAPPAAADAVSDEARPQLFVMEDFQLAKGPDFALHIDQLSLRAGEVAGLIGPNGAGKSLFLECCLGLNTFRAARHRLFGVDFAEWNAVPANRQRVGAKLHRLGFATMYRVRDIVALARAAYGDGNQALLQQLGLADLLDKKYGVLSTGQRQRVDLYFALHQGADLLFLDEPTLGLDDHFTQQLLQLLSEKQQQGAGCVMVSHDERVLAHCDQLWILAAGKIQFRGTPAQLKQQYLSSYRVEVRCADAGPVRASLAAIPLAYQYEQGGALVMFGDQQLLQGFQQLAPAYLHACQVRESQLSDLYAIAGSFNREGSAT